MLNKINSLLGREEFYSPPYEKLFRAFNFKAPEDIKVVIIGEDPYPTPGVADGLAFSTKEEKTPKSLRAIFRCLRIDLRLEHPSNDLSGWAAQGVLLLNTVLTFGHKSRELTKAWRAFTDEVIETVNSKNKPCVWMLWGAAAQEKKVLITSKNALIIEAPHPSPLSRSGTEFANHKPFSRANKFLLKNNISPIDWAL